MVKFFFVDQIHLLINHRKSHNYAYGTWKQSANWEVTFPLRGQYSRKISEVFERLQGFTNFCMQLSSK